MECAKCPEHTGQEERITGLGGKLNLLITLLVLQLGATGTVGMALISKSNEQLITLAIYTEKIQRLEEFKLATIQKLDELDRRVKR